MNESGAWHDAQRILEICDYWLKRREERCNRDDAAFISKKVGKRRFFFGPRITRDCAIQLLHEPMEMYCGMTRYEKHRNSGGYWANKVASIRSSAKELARYEGGKIYLTVDDWDLIAS